MSATFASAGWRVLCGSARGSAHERNSQPNQDAVKIDDNAGPLSVAAAVADGHGSRKCFRSDRGAGFAVAAACDALARLAAAHGTAEATRSLLRAAAEVELPARLVGDWQALVDGDVGKEPFTEAEQGLLSEAERDALAKNPRLAYGTTVVAALDDHFISPMPVV